MLECVCKYIKQRRKNMKFQIRTLIEKANEGMTKEEIKSYFNLDEEQYQEMLQQFSPENREKLRRALIGSAQRAKNPKEVRNVLDACFVSSKFCIFEELKNAFITPLVFEQLVLADNNGNRKVCKFMHLILAKKVDVTLIDKVEFDKKYPKYEDPADMEMIAYAKQNPHIEVVIWTMDKALALRCQQQGIACMFFEK